MWNRKQNNHVRNFSLMFRLGNRFAVGMLWLRTESRVSSKKALRAYRQSGLLFDIVQAFYYFFDVSQLVSQWLNLVSAVNNLFSKPIENIIQTVEQGCDRTKYLPNILNSFTNPQNSLNCSIKLIVDYISDHMFQFLRWRGLRWKSLWCRGQNWRRGSR